MRRIIWASLLLILAGCAGNPTPEQVAKADAGAPPGAEFPDTVRDAVKMTLLDPDSLKDLRVSPPWKCGRHAPIDMFEKPKFGYCAKMSYNAKNSYGGYVGQRAYIIFYRDGIMTWD